MGDVNPNMTRGLYVIRDKVANAFIGTVLAERHPGVACRTFSQLCADKTTVIHQYPKDFELCCVGWIHEDGQVVANNGVEVIMSGESWLALQTSENS